MKQGLSNVAGTGLGKPGSLHWKGRWAEISEAVTVRMKEKTVNNHPPNTFLKCNRN